MSKGDMSPTIRFGKIKAFETKPLSKSVAVEIEADEGESNASDSELWGHGPLLYAPVAPSVTDAVTGAEHCEGMFIQLGDERVVFASKDRRFQIEVAEGEVILRAMGPLTPAYVHLKPDGSAIIKAVTATVQAAAVNMGPTSTPTQAFLRGTAFVSAFNTWLTAHDTYIVIPVPTGPQTATYTAATGVFVTALTASLSAVIKGE